MKKVKIYILLQEYTCWFGHIYRLLKGGTYNHASIGIDGSLNEFYSFRTRWGFCIEHPFQFDKEHKKYVPCAVYELTVTEVAYEQIKSSLALFIQERETYHYSYLSVTLGFLGIKHRFHRGYYCSRFVAHLLSQSGAMALKKDASLYMPSDFLDEIAEVHFEGIAKEYFLSNYQLTLA